MKQAINCDDSPGGVLIDGELGFLASRLPRESWPGINPMSRNDSVVCTASINPRHDRKRGEIAREKEREGTRGRGSLFTLAVAGGIDDYQEDSWSCPRRARSSLSCVELVRTTHEVGRAITRVSKDARLWRVKIQWTWRGEAR